MKLILLRHGESVWNQENKFTGWTDVSLSSKGIDEAIEAGVLLQNIKIDYAFTSVLKRAIETLEYVLKELNYSFKVESSWKLNERHYGALQGLNKYETRAKYGEEQVLIWRRSADVRPPLLSKSDPRYPGFDKKYEGLSDDELPLGENLLDTLKRVAHYYEDSIKKHLYNENVLIVAHGNSLRALIMHLESISASEIMKIEIPTGKPLIYELDENLNILNKYYL